MTTSSANAADSATATIGSRVRRPVNARAKRNTNPCMVANPRNVSLENSTFSSVGSTAIIMP